MAHARRPIISDVALNRGGQLDGTVLDPQGNPLPGVAVLVRQAAGRTFHATTNPAGRFQVAGLGGGMYQVLAAGGHATFRLWAAGTAPPAAQGAALIVAGGRQYRAHSAAPISLSPDALILTGIILGAIAIPLAVSNAQINPDFGS